jgi:transcriptional regulator with XRE-family HTH domain
MTPSREARLRAGYTLSQAARAINRKESYLAQLERSNCFPISLARKLADFYGCRIDLFTPAAKCLMREPAP